MLGTRGLLRCCTTEAASGSRAGLRGASTSGRMGAWIFFVFLCGLSSYAILIISERPSQHQAHVANKEQWLPIASIIESTPQRAARRISALNAVQAEEVRSFLQQISLRTRREEELLRAEHARQDQDLRDVR
jgi:cell shape-determining protein MreC